MTDEWINTCILTRSPDGLQEHNSWKSAHIECNTQRQEKKNEKVQGEKEQEGSKHL